MPVYNANTSTVPHVKLFKNTPFVIMYDGRLINYHDYYTLKTKLRPNRGIPMLDFKPP